MYDNDLFTSSVVFLDDVLPFWLIAMMILV